MQPGSTRTVRRAGSTRTLFIIDWGKRACAVIASYDGTAADGQKAMAPLLDAVPPPIFNWMSAIPFRRCSRCSIHFPKGL